MNRKSYTVLTAIALAASAASAAVAQETAAGRETAPVTTESVSDREESTPPEWKPFKVCVLDFNTIDIFGQQRFLDVRNKPIVIPPQCMLDDADHRSISPYMQGYVRMMDAYDISSTNEANREAQIEDNVFTRQKALALFDSVMNGPSRPMVIGADYLSAYLGSHNDVFACMDISQVAAAMKKLQAEPDFPKDFMLRLARETGATHLIYGTVSDLSSKTKAFSGYGIQTSTTTYQLDVIVKMIDLAAQRSVYSNVYTGTYREQLPASGEAFDNNIFQSLMKSALEQAADDFYEACREGGRNRVAITPMPWFITVKPVGVGIEPARVAVFADGVLAGAGGETFSLPEGMHRIEVHADGYIAKAFKLNVKSDMNVSITLEPKQTRPQPDATPDPAAEPDRKPRPDRKADPEAEPDLDWKPQPEQTAQPVQAAQPVQSTEPVQTARPEQTAEPEQTAQPVQPPEEASNADGVVETEVTGRVEVDDADDHVEDIDVTEQAEDIDDKKEAGDTEQAGETAERNEAEPEKSEAAEQ